MEEPTAKGPRTIIDCPGQKLFDNVRLLHQPKALPKIEIVFVHGLELFSSRDACRRTWLARDGSNTYWPMTWLKDVLPDARILALAYDSSMRRTSTHGRMDLYALGETLVQEMVSIARIGQNGALVVFVCHSFGGLVAKQIVISAHQIMQENSDAQYLLRNIGGFFFYATPHAGSRLTNVASHRCHAMGPLMDLVGILNKDAGRLHAEFQRIQAELGSNRWCIAVVAENCETKYNGYDGMIVEEASARHGYSRFILVGTDHFNVCRPRSTNDTSFQFLISFLKEVVEKNVIALPLQQDSLLVGLSERDERLQKLLKIAISLQQKSLLIGPSEGEEHLTELDLSGLALRSLPESIRDGENLKKLNVSGCRKSENLPDRIRGLEQLIELDLHDCISLARLPESIRDLESLEKLNVSGCWKLKKLPDSIGRLKHLIERFT